MATASTYGTMALCMRASGMKTKLMAEEFTSGQMVENIMVSGKIITCMAKEFIPGKTAGDMRENMIMIANTGTASTPGMTASSMKAGGKMESNMEKEPTEKTDVTDLVFGRTANVSNGSMIMVQLKWAQMKVPWVCEIYNQLSL